MDPVRQDRLPIAADYLPGVFSFAQQAEPLLYFLIAFLVLFGFLVGASYIGADLNSGGVVNLLLWRPRRLTVLGAKLGTLLGTVLALALVASLVYLATFWVIGQTAGLAGRLSGDFWRSLGAIHGRGLVLVLLATALGFAIATLGRHTSAALGAAAAYAVVWELGARLVLEIIDARRPDQLMLSSYIGAWLTGEAQFLDPRVCAGRSDNAYCDGLLQPDLGAGAGGAARDHRWVDRGGVRRVPPPRPDLRPSRAAPRGRPGSARACSMAAAGEIFLHMTAPAGSADGGAEHLVADRVQRGAQRAAQDRLLGQPGGHHPWPDQGDRGDLAAAPARPAPAPPAWPTSPASTTSGGSSTTQVLATPSASRRASSSSSGPPAAPAATAARTASAASAARNPCSRATARTASAAGQLLEGRLGAGRETSRGMGAPGTGR